MCSYYLVISISIPAWLLGEFSTTLLQQFPNPSYNLVQISCFHVNDCPRHFSQAITFRVYHCVCCSVGYTLSSCHVWHYLAIPSTDSSREDKFLNQNTHRHLHLWLQLLVAIWAVHTTISLWGWPLLFPQWSDKMGIPYTIPILPVICESSSSTTAKAFHHFYL